MKQADESAGGWRLPAEMLVDQAGLAIIVTDPGGVLRYVNAAAVRLFRVDDADRLLGRPIAALGLADGDEDKTFELVSEALHGGLWEGTLTSLRGDGSTLLARFYSVPLHSQPPARDSAGPAVPYSGRWGPVCGAAVPPGVAGTADGVVIVAREARSRGNLRERDKIGLLERFDEKLGSSLELDTTLRHVAEMLVPQFADHCLIDLYRGDALIRRMSKHAGGWEPAPGTWARAGERISYPPGHFCEQAMSRLETIVVADLGAEHYPAPSPESMSAATEAGMVSVVASPLRARGELLGVMSLALSGLTGRSDQHYGADERDLFGAIAARVAVAIDNAMLFEAERQTALAFQESLLPQELPVLDGLELACRYIPARPLVTHGQGVQTQVGGDWYDIIPLAAGRVGIVIGDVEGRGARAAAMMGQLKAALGAFAQDERAPAEILRKLDDWCRSLPPADSGGPHAADPPMASCIYLVYDPWSRELSFANAGHDAPLLVTSEAVPLEASNKGVLLGLRGKGIAGLPTYKEERLVLPPGATLVLYTDGLTDRRGRADGPGHYTEEEALAMVRQAITAAAAGGADAIAHAAEHAVPGEIDDDMAILVVRSLPDELPSRQQIFPAEPVMVSRARALAAETFEEWGMDSGQCEIACLLVSEVATNAVLHASVTPAPRRRFDLELSPPVGMPPPRMAPGDEPRPPAAAPASPVTVIRALPNGRGVPDPAAEPGLRGPEGPQGMLDDTELRGNEAGQPARNFAVRLRRGASAVWAEIFDPDLRLPRIRTASENDEGGRGLYLVEQLAVRWGSRPTREGKVVWFEVPLRDK